METTIAINAEYHAKQFVNFCSGKPDSGFETRDDYIDATVDATGLEWDVVADLYDSGYYVAVGGLEG